MHLPDRSAVWLLLAMTGCAGSVEVTRTFTPQAATQAQAQLRPVAIVRAEDRIPLPGDVRIEPRRIVLSPARQVVRKFTPGDTVAQLTRPPDDVRDSRTDATNVILLQPSDTIEMHGTFKPDDALPGGGRVVSARWSKMLLAGLVVFSLSYVPAVYVGFGSPRDVDRPLMLPLAGPWIDLANRPGCAARPLPNQPPMDPCIGETASRTALVVSGVLQDLGLLFTIGGLPAHSRIVPDREQSAVPAKRRPEVAIVPTLTGAIAVGSF
jgi:hypothetical protein